ncbi:DUF7519 family protein [Haloarcula pelagica]|uniref:DUF7519 family protein n=1 Tax=Haloarcula pelagica TaxID=3033389 RepID=UPI003AF31DBD
MDAFGARGRFLPRRRPRAGATDPGRHRGDGAGRRRLSPRRLRRRGGDRRSRRHRPCRALRRGRRPDRAARDRRRGRRPGNPRRWRPLRRRLAVARRRRRRAAADPDPRADPSRRVPVSGRRDRVARFACRRRAPAGGTRVGDTGGTGHPGGPRADPPGPGSARTPGAAGGARRRTDRTARRPVGDQRDGPGALRPRRRRLGVAGPQAGAVVDDARRARGRPRGVAAPPDGPACARSCGTRAGAVRRWRRADGGGARGRRPGRQQRGGARPGRGAGVPGRRRGRPRLGSDRVLRAAYRRGGAHGRVAARARRGDGRALDRPVRRLRRRPGERGGARRGGAVRRDGSRGDAVGVAGAGPRGIVAAVVVWDAGAFGATLGRELGAAVGTRRTELLHVGGTVAVGSVGAGVAAALAGGAGGALSVPPGTALAALVVCVLAVLALVAALR